MPDSRVGNGYDIHRLVPGRPLVLGGVLIPFPKGVQGHSDGDPVAHAVVDALLGAAALGDIGKAFPDTDPAFANIDSKLLLAEASRAVAGKGWSVRNVDVTVLLEAPRLAPHTHLMVAAIAQALGVEGSAVSVKAKTNEGLGEIGRGEAVACFATVLIAAASPTRTGDALG